ncbi:MAG: site-specific integrase [Actinobacteria bacterium]|nr:site-specific integrase [Actinomycetota bacterium]
MPGNVFKRCRGCGRRIKPKKRGCDNPKCAKPGVRWSFVIDLGRRGDGKRRQVLRSGFETKGEAERALEEFVNQSRQGVEPTNITVKDYLLDRWLPRTRTSVKTRNDRETHMRAYVIPRIGGFKLVNLTGEELNEMYDDLAVRGRTQRRDPELGWGLSPTTIRRIHTQLHKAFADAMRWGLIIRNPCDQADPPSTTEVKARALASRNVYSWAQLQRLVRAAAEDRLFAMWQLFVSTGMRRSEMAALRWDHVDLEAAMLSVVRGAVEDRGKVYEKEFPKSSSSRRAVELAPADVDVLDLHRKVQEEEAKAAQEAWKHKGHVFTSPVGGRLYPPDITKMFHALTDAAGLPRIRLHDMRHTHATLLLKAGEVTKVVTERLGHSTTAYTQDAYQHVLPGMQRDAATRFHERLAKGDGDDEDAADEPETRHQEQPENDPEGDA